MFGKVFISLILLLVVLAAALRTDTSQGLALAPRPGEVFSQGPVQVGEVEPVHLEISYLDEASWTQIIQYPQAAYIKIHFLKMDLRPGDYITVSEPSGSQLHTYPSPAKHHTTGEEEDFWALSIIGDTAIIELHSGQAVEAAPSLGVVIDKYARGYSSAEIAQRVAGGILTPESTCGASQRFDVACYQGSHPMEFSEADAVALLLLNGGTAVCTAWRVGPNNRMFTNEHCITSQAQVNAAEVWFNYQKPSCGSGNPFTNLTQASGKTLLIDDETLDFALFSVDNFASLSSFGYLELDVRTPVLGEEIYVPQHGAGNPKEFGIESPDFNLGGLCQIDDAVRDGLGVNTDTGYYCDTTEGSSGSPVVARSSHKVIGLHHFGVFGACGEFKMNQGVRINRIWPLVKPYLGSDRIVINELDLGNSDAVEFYNASADAIAMTDWRFKAYRATGSVDVDYTFPSFILQPGTYVVLHEGSGTNSATNLYIGSGPNISWVNAGSGAAALINDSNKGIDFVRFKNSSISPPTGTGWTGTNPASPPLGQTLGRDSASTDTDDGSDWCFGDETLGGQNTCPAATSPPGIYLPVIMNTSP